MSAGIGIIHTRAKTLKCCVLLQSIYDEVLENHSTLVRQQLVFANCKSMINHARAEGKPTSTPSVEELIQKFEGGEYPERFATRFLGSVSAKIKGEDLLDQWLLLEGLRFLGGIV